MNERANLNSNENIRKWDYEWKKEKERLNENIINNESMNEKANVNSNENIRKWEYEWKKEKERLNENIRKIKVWMRKWL